MKRIGVLLAALLVLTGLPFYAATAESSFTGVVTYRSGKNVYLQSGSQGILAFLDSTNDPDQMAAVRVGTVITVSGEPMTLNQAGYHIPELIDAMIVDISGTQNLPSPVSATVDQLGDLFKQLGLSLDAGSRSGLPRPRLKPPISSFP